MVAQVAAGVPSCVMHPLAKIAVPLTAVNRGQSRLLAGTRRASSGRLTCGELADSQADSASSILVTRSHLKAQVRALDLGTDDESSVFLAPLSVPRPRATESGGRVRVLLADENRVGPYALP